LKVALNIPREKLFVFSVGYLEQKFSYTLEKLFITNRNKTGNAVVIGSCVFVDRVEINSLLFRPQRFNRSARERKRDDEIRIGHDLGSAQFVPCKDATRILLH